MFLVTELVLGLHTNNQPWIVWAAPGVVAVSFFLFKGILSPVGPAHLNQQGCVGPIQGFNRSSRALLSGVGEKRLRPATRPIHNAGTFMKPEIT